jgi:hypothetical protein
MRRITYASSMFNFSCCQLNIVLTKDGICILIDIVISDPMHVDLLLQSCTTQGFADSNATQTKKNSYCDQHLTNQFFPLASEVFRCLHKQTNMFSTCLCSYVIMSMSFETSNNQKILSFLSWFFFSSNFFHYVTKDSSIFHLKFDGNGRPN